MRTFTRLLKSFSARGQKKATPRRHRLALEPLEDRLALANFTWTGCESSLWSDPRNWLELQAPTPIDLEGNRVLYFPETACSTSSTNDIGVVATSRVRIEGDGFSISGGTLRLSRGPSDYALLVEGDQTFLSSNLELVSPDMLFEVRSIIRFTVAGAVSGAGGFRKVGEGYLVLTEGNTYIGTTTVNRGRLEVSHPRALGDTAGSTIINDQGTLILKSDSSGGTESLTLHGLGASLDGALLAQGTLTWSGTIELGSEETAVSVGGATAELTLDGVIRNKTGRTGGLSKGGIGTLRLAGNQPNSYTGTTKVNTGKLILEKNPGVTAVKGPLVIGDNFGPARSDQVRVFYPDQISDTAAVTVNARGVFEVRGATGVSTIETIGALTLNGGVVSLGTGLDTGILTLAGNVTATSVTLDGQNQPASIEGGYLELGAFTRTFTVNDGPGGTELTVLSQVSDGGLTKAGTGNMRLAAANTYSGFTAIDAGTLRIDGNQATSPVVVNTGGTLAGDGTVKVLTVNAGGTVRPLAGQSLTVGWRRFIRQREFLLLG